MNKVIINADDFGLSPGVNQGILYCFKHHLISSTTIMCNMEYFEDALEIYRHNSINVGVHLTLTAGKALLKHQYITDKQGYFIKQGQYKSLDMNQEVVEEIKAEWNAQIQKALDAGIKVTHLDTHHHMYMAYPALHEVIYELARKYHLPIRNDHVSLPDKPDDILDSDHFIRNFDAHAKDLIEGKDHIELEEGITEIMVHPAFVDYYLMTHSSMNIVRASSLEALKTIDQSQIELISYAQI